MIVYYGNSTSCTRYDLAPIDYAEALSRPDGAMWASEPQSSTVVDMTAASLAASRRRWHSQGVEHPVPSTDRHVAEYAARQAADEANHAAHKAFLAAVEEGRLHPQAAEWGLHP
jgi:hypothetical protein